MYIIMKARNKFSKTRLVIMVMVLIFVLWGLNHLSGEVGLMYSPELDYENIFGQHHQDTLNTLPASKTTNQLYRNTVFPAQTEMKQTSAKQCNIINVNERFDCHPDTFASKDRCESRGCCWHSVTDNELRQDRNVIVSDQQGRNVNIPYCYYPRNFQSYAVTKVRNTSLGMQAELVKQSAAYYPKDVKRLIVDVMYETNRRLHIKIFDADSRRYEVPLDVPKPEQAASNPQYNVLLSDVGDTFKLNVRRQDSQSGKPLFLMDGAAPLIFTDQYLQLSSILPSTVMYGLGEHRDGLQLNMNWTRLTFWNVDQPPQEGDNLYGSHPFYLLMEDDGQASGFFMLNSNAMEAVLQPTPAITWRTIGGILDFYIFIGQSPADVVSEYTKVIGRTFMPPYWSLGFHICRFGYKNVSDTMAVVDRVRKAAIPQDVQWNDIDYAIGKRDFTTDTVRFGDQAAMVQGLHYRGMKYIVIVDPGISNSQSPGTYRPYDLGVEMDIFIKNNTGQPLVGKVWPGSTVFSDFSHPDSLQYWSTLIAEFTHKIHVDGLWIDMNEISNFIDGSEEGCPVSEYDNPPYVPAVVGGKLYHKTICNSAVQKLSRNYNLHNLYGLMETNITYHALKRVLRGQRPFIISRSTFAGQGYYGGHWTGDNFATFHDLYRSISAIVTMSMLGIPMVGADICGFHDDTNYELCLRWYQLGAFYPFSRSHNSDDVKKDQDPGAFDSYFESAVRSVYETRYSLLPLLYTLFYTSHITGAPVARGMFYQFPKDTESYEVDTQFMWGSELLIAPVVTKGAKTVSVYLPPDTVWYNISTGYQYNGQGSHVTLTAPLDVINVLVQGGSVIPIQQPALTTSQSRKNDFSLLVAMGRGNGSGSLYWDDGDSRQVVKSSYRTNMILSSVKFYGFPQEPSTVTLGGTRQQFLYVPSTKVLTIPKLVPTVDITKQFVIEWQSH